MARGKVYKMSESELKHGWLKLSPAIRNKLIAIQMKIVEADSTSDRDRNIAIKNLLAMNAQNIGLDKDAPQAQQDIKIEITEVAANDVLPTPRALDARLSSSPAQP